MSINEKKSKNKAFVHEVPIAGVKIKVLRTEIEINQIELDSENPRWWKAETYSKLEVHKHY